MRMLPTAGGEPLAKASLENHRQQAVAAVSGDRLAQIEELRRSGQLGAITVSDVLALVEVAKAARAAEPVLDELIGWINTDLIGCLEVEQRGEQARLAIRSALARLDRSSSDGTADSGAAEGD